jgi:hypothetical protein
MNRPELSQERILELLRQQIKPVEPHTLSHDLWPRMLRRLDEKGRPISLFDWALLATAVVLTMMWPQSIAGLFYQL